MNAKVIIMKKDVPIAVQIILFPLTAYLFVGTVCLFFISKIEELIQTIGRKTKSHYFGKEFEVTLYHKKHFWYTFFFFIFFPFLLIYYFVLLMAVNSIYLYEYITATVEILYEKIIKQVQLLWNNISNMFK